MTEDDIATAVRNALAKVAPELEGEDIEPDVDFRDQFDLDSMDMLNFVIALHEDLAVDIPEKDYPRLASLAACVDYLSSRIDAAAGGG